MSLEQYLMGQQCGEESKEKIRTLHTTTEALHLSHSVHQMRGAQNLQ